MRAIVSIILAFLFTIFTTVDVHPISRFEQNLIRQRRENEHIISDLWQSLQPVLNDHFNSHFTASTKLGCERTAHIDGGYIEYCREKHLNPDSQSYSIKTSSIWYKTDGTILPLHQAESDIAIE